MIFISRETCRTFLSLENRSGLRTSWSLYESFTRFTSDVCSMWNCERWISGKCFAIAFLIVNALWLHWIMLADCWNIGFEIWKYFERNSSRIWIRRNWEEHCALFTCKTCCPREQVSFQKLFRMSALIDNFERKFQNWILKLIFLFQIGWKIAKKFRQFWKDWNINLQLQKNMLTI